MSTEKFEFNFSNPDERVKAMWRFITIAFDGRTLDIPEGSTLYWMILHFFGLSMQIKAGFADLKPGFSSIMNWFMFCQNNKINPGELSMNLVKGAFLGIGLSEGYLNPDKSIYSMDKDEFEYGTADHKLVGYFSDN